MEFVLVYIREAHPIDGDMPMEFGMIEDPISHFERVRVARRCVSDLEIEMPAVVDKMDDAVNKAYHGWPERLYLVAKGGKIAYVGGLGPFGFEPEELDAAIRKELVGHTKGADAAARKPKR